MEQFAQELLSTFSTAIGEVALIPATGGIFKVAIQHEVLERPSSEVQARSRGIETVTTKTLWDRGVDGGFPGRLCFISFGFRETWCKGRGEFQGVRGRG